jgi:cysteine-rich repeat protein
MVAAMFLALGCAKEAGTSSETGLGGVSMAVVMDDASQITSVHWAVTDSADALVREGLIDVSDPSATISTYISGLPAGTGYTMTLDAVLMKDGAEVGGCSQTATFNVVIDQTTTLEMTLNCTLNSTVGDVIIDAEANICPTIDYFTVTPTTQAIGKVVTLGSEASDKDTGDVITYSWTADAGTVTNPTSANASYTCSLTGPIQITLSITDNVTAANDNDPCLKTKTITIQCVSAAICGDGTVGPGEQCDDMNTVSEDGCSSLCRTESCGDGVVQAGLGEECDPPNGTTCDATCIIPGCGNGVLEAGEGCDDHNKTACDGCSSSCQPEACGNGVLECTEACDDHNLVNGDGCEANCTVTPDYCLDPTVGCSPLNCHNYMGEDVLNACYAATATNPALCGAVMDCAHSTGCVMENASGVAWPDPNPNKCYCGTATVPQCMTGMANGECKAQVEAAAGTTDPMTIGERFADPNYAIGDAFAVLTCEQAKCASECL